MNHSESISVMAMDRKMIFNGKEEIFLVDNQWFLLSMEELEIIKKIAERQIELLNDEIVEKYNSERHSQMNGFDPYSRSRKVSKNKNKGHVYLIKSDNGYYKIGRSKDLKSRLNQLNKNVPYKIELIHAHEVDDTVKFEKMMHQKFSGSNHVGEWFSLTGKQVEEFKAMSFYE